jgi:hypothetical protein
VVLNLSQVQSGPLDQLLTLMWEGGDWPFLKEEVTTHDFPQDCEDLIHLCIQHTVHEWVLNVQLLFCVAADTVVRSWLVKVGQMDPSYHPSLCSCQMNEGTVQWKKKNRTPISVSCGIRRGAVLNTKRENRVIQGKSSLETNDKRNISLCVCVFFSGR